MIGTRWRIAAIIPAFLIAASLATRLAYADENPSDVLATISSMIDRTQVATSHLKAGDVTAARDDGEEIERTWEGIEHLIAQRDPRAEEEVDEAIDQVGEALRANTPPTDASNRLDRLRATLIDLREDLETGVAPSPPSTDQISVGEGIRLLQATDAALARGDVASAREAYEQFQQRWPSLEGRVSTASPAAYHEIESQMPRVATALTGSSVDAAQVRSVVAEMLADLEPLVGQEQHYGPFDAAITLMREGLEALLIIGALLALVTRSGRSDLRWQVWVGAGVGVLASLAVAALLQIALSHLAVGLNRELLEGVTGLGAAVMLLYVSYWLHQQSSLADWRKFLASRTGLAVSSGNLLILPSLAFLAVFREGAETILLYAGMATSISLRDLVVGMGMGLIALAVFGIGLFGFGLRLSLKPFFRVISVLLYYLAFKFVGTGIHALQVAGALPATSADYLPSLSFVGIFPTWQTTVAQGLLVAAAILVIAWIAANQRARDLTSGTS